MKLLILGFFAASIGCAKDFYVSPSGSDRKAGTMEAPWKTLQHAVEKIQPGDTILVESGTYAGCQIQKSGSKNAPKTLKAAPDAKVIVKSPGPSNLHDSNIEMEDPGAIVSDWVVEGFEVTDSPKYGIDVRGTERVVIRGNRVHGSALTGIFTAFSNNILIENNETWQNGEHGIYQSNSSQYPVIRNNKSHHNAKAGIHLNGDLSEGPPGMIRFATIESNEIWENGLKGASGINCDGVDDSLIQKNVLMDNHASGISLYGIDAAHSSSNNKVLDNTIVMAPRSRDVMNIPDDGQVAPPVGNVIRGNVLCTPDADHASILIWSPTAKGFQSENNTVVNRFSADNDKSKISLAQWQKLGFDAGSKLGCEAFLHKKTGDSKP